MNRNQLLSIIPLMGLCAFLLFSSFNKPTDRSPSPEPAPEAKYRGVSKRSTKNGLMKMSCGFQNDYFTQQQNEGFYYIELEADKFQNSDYTRPPMNLSIVIDRSGSMSGAKISNAKKAAKHIVDNLQSDDYLSIIIYDQSVQTLHHQSLVRNKSSIKHKIDEIQDRGSTNLMGGAMQGYSEVKKSYRSGYINRVLLLSDGLANEGITDPSRINRIVQNKFREENIAISTFGVGNDYNEDLMTAMAENGNGNYYFIEKPGEIASIFRKELNGLMEVVAQNTMLSLSLPPAVRIEKVYGYTHTQKGNHVSIKLNDIFSEERKGILVKYRITQAEMPNTLNFTTSVSYSLASNKRNQRMSLRNQQRFTNSTTVYNEHFSEWVDAQVVLNEANYKMEMAMKAIDRGDYVKGKKMVKETRNYISSKSTLVTKSKELQRAQTANADYEEEIADIENVTETEKKYIQKSNKSMNYKIRRKK